MRPQEVFLIEMASFSLDTYIYILWVSTQKVPIQFTEYHSEFVSLYTKSKSDTANTPQLSPMLHKRLYQPTL